jgi:5-methylcytosine-specific restriction endonuclease McrA
MTNVDATADHIFPRSLGGKNIAKNLVAACIGCNKDKKNIPYQEYLERIAA